MEEIKQYNDYAIYQHLTGETQETIDSFMVCQHTDGDPIRSPKDLMNMHESIAKRVAQQNNYSVDSFKYMEEVITPRYNELFRKLVIPTET